MATGKRYYWIKLKDSFMGSDEVDYLMGLPDGANYVVLYQMLCLKTINTGGRLSHRIGEILVPYDVDKIKRDCKWFSADTIRVALNLYRSFGLIYEDVDGTLVLSDYKDLVGSETDWALQKRNQKLNAAGKAALPPSDEVESGVEIFHTEKEKDIDIYNTHTNAGAPACACEREETGEAGGACAVGAISAEAEAGAGDVAPSLSDVVAELRRLRVKDCEAEAEAFLRYNEARGFTDNWRLKAALWARRAEKLPRGRRAEATGSGGMDADAFFAEALKKTYGEDQT